MEPRREDFITTTDYIRALNNWHAARNALLMQRQVGQRIREEEELTSRMSPPRLLDDNFTTVDTITTTSNSEEGVFRVNASGAQRTTGWTSSFDRPQQVDTDTIERVVDFYKPKKKAKMDEKVLKQRHLGRDERSMFHQPKSDWCESPKGDICKSACSLEVSDLVAKIK